MATKWHWMTIYYDYWPCTISLSPPLYCVLSLQSSLHSQHINSRNTSSSFTVCPSCWWNESVVPASLYIHEFQRPRCQIGQHWGVSICLKSCFDNLFSVSMHYVMEGQTQFSVQICSICLIASEKLSTSTIIFLEWSLEQMACLLGTSLGSTLFSRTWLKKRICCITNMNITQIFSTLMHPRDIKISYIYQYMAINLFKSNLKIYIHHTSQESEKDC